MDTSIAMVDTLVSKREQGGALIKVLEITQASGGGVQKYVSQLCRYLDKSRFAVTGCCSTESLANTEAGDIPFAELFEQAGVPYFLIPMKRAIHPVNDFMALCTMYRRIKEAGFDIVHAHSSKAGVLARIAARMAGVPVVLYSPHAFSFAVPERTIGTSTYAFFERIAARFCDGIITDSPGERDLALTYRICGAEKIRVITPGVEAPEETLGNECGERAQILGELGIDGNDKVVSFIGRLALQKDPLTFVRSAQRLGDGHDGVSFLLVGDGPLRKQCAQAVAANDLNGRIKLLGWRRDYQKIVAGSDIVVLCSRYEGLPFILLESMAQGKPIVATDVTGISDVITDGKDGILVPPHAPERLAEACIQILKGPVQAGRMADAARAKVLQQFSVEKCVSLTEETYIHLLKNKRTDHG